MPGTCVSDQTLRPHNCDFANSTNRWINSQHSYANLMYNKPDRLAARGCRRRDHESIPAVQNPVNRVWPRRIPSRLGAGPLLLVFPPKPRRLTRPRCASIMQAKIPQG